MEVSGLHKLIRKIDETGNADWRLDSGWLHTAGSATKIEEVQELALSQEEKPQSHNTQRQIVRQSGISSALVNAIIKKDLRLMCFKKSKAQQLTSDNKLARLNRCQQLLRRWPVFMVNFIWFTGFIVDQKRFLTNVYVTVFLLSRKHLIKILSSSENVIFVTTHSWRHNYVIASKEYLMNGSIL